jgi:hypothetical protein
MSVPSNRIERFFQNPSAEADFLESSVWGVDCELEDAPAAFPEPESYLSPEGAAEVIRLKLQCSELAAKVATCEETITGLSRRLSQLEVLVPAILESPSFDEVQSAIARVTLFTNEIFDSKAVIAQLDDCDLPGRRYFEVAVTEAGDVEAAVSKNHQWHLRLAELPSNTRGLFSLIIDPQ